FRRVLFRSRGVARCVSAPSRHQSALDPRAHGGESYRYPRRVPPAEHSIRSVSMDLTDVRALMSHMAWADALTWRCVLGTPAAHDDDRVRHLVVHIHVVQNAYVTIWNRKPRSEEHTSELQSRENLVC